MLTGSGGMWIRKGKLNYICRQAQIEQRNMGISSCVVIYDIFFLMLKFLLSISMEKLTHRNNVLSGAQGERLQITTKNMDSPLEILICLED
jgi:hypothetical protein